jgi:cell division ATPase FtsA
MRKLNIALVDIGAGTSDIAISSEGSINAYGMVPMAGDEITEKISQDYLLDFNEAERIKRLMEHSEEIEYKDVLGFTNTVRSEELLGAIDLTASNLAGEIVKTIFNLNVRAPQAVILIGGGSLTPEMSKKVAQNLGLPENRVAVQKASSVNDLINLPVEYSGPEFITPIGIALTCRNDSNLGFIQVMVNDYPVSVLNLGANTVFDALLSAGISVDKVYPRSGTPKTIKVNGKVQIISGSQPVPSEIFINEEKGRVEDNIQENDFINFIPGKEGSEAKISIRDILPDEKKIYIGFEEIVLPIEIIVDGAATEDFDQELGDNANVSIRQIDSLGEIMGIIKPEYMERIDYNISTDNNLRFKSLYRYEFYCNGEKAGVKLSFREWRQN